MSRFLLVVPPLVGHVNPLVGVAAELQRRGHDVAWAGHAELVHRLAGGDQRVFDCAMPDTGLVRSADLTGPAAFRFLWEDFLLPLAAAMAPGVADALDAFTPDVVLCDQHAVAGSLVAERFGVPYVTSASTSAELVDPLAAMPKVARWLTGRLTALRADLGGDGTADPRFSPHGVLAFTARELVGETGPGVRVLGPAIAPRRTAPDFPWEDLDLHRAVVLVTLGTANTDAGSRFLTETAAALHLLADRVQGVVADPGHVLAGVPLPAGTIVREYVPQLALLSEVDAVVSHGGHNTVCESLWHGVPLVLAPIRDDQPIVAGQVVDAGAGVRVRFGRVDAARLAVAVDSVLDPASGCHAAAAAIGRRLRAGDAVRAAADFLAAVSDVGVRTPR